MADTPAPIPPSGTPGPVPLVAGWAVAAYAAGAAVQCVLLGPAGPGQVASQLGRTWWWAWAAAALWLMGGALPSLLLTRPRTHAGLRVDVTRGLWTACGLGVVACAAPILSAHGWHLLLPLTSWLLAVPLCLVIALFLPSTEKLLAHRFVPHVAGLLAGLWFFTVSYLRHAWFGSGSKDMGLFLQSVWLLSRFHSPENTVMGMNAFADHMEFVDVLCAPLMWLWSDAGMLLLVQGMLAGSGATPVFRMARERFGSSWAGLLAAGAYFFSHEIISGIMFDWNPTTLALGAFPWAVEAALNGRWRRMGLFLCFIALCKENLLLYVAAFGVWLVVVRAPWRVWTATVLGAAIAFVVEIKLVFPIFRSGGFRHFYFTDMGADFLDVMVNAVASPARSVALLFTPAAKVNGVVLPLSSTGFLGLLSPATLITAVPGVLERYWSNFQNSWWGHHYGGPTHALAVCAAVLGGARLGQWLSRRQTLSETPGLQHAARLFPACVLLISSVGASFLGPWGAADLFVLRKPYHPSEADRVTMAAAVESVPPGVSVAAQNYLLAHLAARERIYQLEHADLAEYVVMTPTTNPWPYDRGYHDRLAQQLLAQGARVHFCEGNSFVLARDAGNSVPCPVLGR